MYSANFAFHHGAEPVGSGYHMSLQQSRMTVSASYMQKLQQQQEHEQHEQQQQQQQRQQQRQDSDDV